MGKTHLEILSPHTPARASMRDLSARVHGHCLTRSCDQAMRVSIITYRFCEADLAVPERAYFSSPCFPGDNPTAQLELVGHLHAEVPSIEAATLQPLAERHQLKRS